MQNGHPGEVTRLELMNSLMSKVKSATRNLITHGASGYFWLVGNDETVSLLTQQLGFYSTSGQAVVFDGQIPLGSGEVLEHGILNQKWRVFEDFHLDSDVLLVGCSNKEEKVSHHAVIKL